MHGVRLLQVSGDFVEDSSLTSGQRERQLPLKALAQTAGGDRTRLCPLVLDRVPPLGEHGLHDERLLESKPVACALPVPCVPRPMDRLE